MIEAVRRYPKFKNIPEIEISITISKWMAQATNRINKKNKDNQTTIFS